MARAFKVAGTVNLNKNAGKETLGDHATNITLDAIKGFASFFGLGDAAEGLIRNFNKGLIPTSAEIETLINQAISKAKAQGTASLEQLRNKLNNLSLPKSIIQERAIEKYVDRVQKEIQKQTTSLSLADDLANQALTTASGINYAKTSSKRKIANEALEQAETAKKAYNNVVNAVKVENEI